MVLNIIIITILLLLTSSSLCNIPSFLCDVNLANKVCRKEISG